MLILCKHNRYHFTNYTVQCCFCKKNKDLYKKMKKMKFGTKKIAFIITAAILLEVTNDLLYQKTLSCF